MKQHYSLHIPTYLIKNDKMKLNTTTKDTHVASGTVYTICAYPFLVTALDSHFALNLQKILKLYRNSVYTSFYKKLRSGHRTKSVLISHEILSILVLKVSRLVSYFLNAELSMWSLTLRQI